MLFSSQKLEVRRCCDARMGLDSSLVMPGRTEVTSVENSSNQAWKWVAGGACVGTLLVTWWNWDKICRKPTDTKRSESIKTESDVSDVAVTDPCDEKRIEGGSTEGSHSRTSSREFADGTLGVLMDSDDSDIGARDQVASLEQPVRTYRKKPIKLADIFKSNVRGHPVGNGMLRPDWQNTGTRSSSFRTEKRQAAQQEGPARQLEALMEAADEYEQQLAKFKKDKPALNTRTQEFRKNNLRQKLENLERIYGQVKEAAGVNNVCEKAVVDVRAKFEKL